MTSLKLNLGRNNLIKRFFVYGKKVEEFNIGAFNSLFVSLSSLSYPKNKKLKLLKLKMYKNVNTYWINRNKQKSTMKNQF